MDLSNKALRLQRKPRKGKGFKYGPEDRIDAVTKWLALGNMRIVSEITGISYELLRLWKTQPWWSEAVAEIKAARQFKVDNKLSKIVDRSLDMIEDRLENGEVVLTKDNEIVRIPVKLRDITKAANDLMSRQIEMAKLEVKETETQQQQSVQDQIRMLAEEFSKFNKARTITLPADVEDAKITGEADSAVHEKS